MPRQPLSAPDADRRRFLIVQMIIMVVFAVWMMAVSMGILPYDSR